MKNILQKIILGISSLCIVANTYAIDAPMNVQLLEAKEDSLSISWDPVEGALGYYVQFGTETGNYTMSLDDLIETNSTSLTALESATQYFVVVTTIAMDVDEDGGVSDEAAFTTLGGTITPEPVSIEEPAIEEIKTESIQEDFKLESIEVVAYDKLKLTFNSNLENAENVEREFKITNVADEFDQVEVINTELAEDNSQELILTLAREITVGNEYNLVVIALKDIDGRNLESWHDSTETFVAPETIEEVELNAAPVEVIPSSEGVEVSEDEIDKSTLSSATEVDQLPQTGPELVFIFILTLILGTCLFVFRYKRS